jgi:hypothetical protein
MAAPAPAVVALVPVIITIDQIISAIKNVYVRQLAEIGGISGGAGAPAPNTMKTPWNRDQFRRLATATVVPASAIAAPLPGAIPPNNPAAWADYTNLDYTNVVAVAGASVARDKTRVAAIQCDLRAPGDIGLLLTNIFNGDFMIHQGRTIFRIPKSSELLVQFITPFIYKNMGVNITISTPGGVPPTDILIAGALIPQMMSTGVLASTSQMIIDMYIDQLDITNEQKESFRRYDERIDQIRNALI